MKLDATCKPDSPPGAPLAAPAVDLSTPISALQAQEKTVETLFDKATPSVVYVQTFVEKTDRHAVRSVRASCGDETEALLVPLGVSADGWHAGPSVADYTYYAEASLASPAGRDVWHRHSAGHFWRLVHGHSPRTPRGRWHHWPSLDL